VKVLITLTIRLELNFTQENQRIIEFGMYFDFRILILDSYFLVDLDDWLTVHRNITLIDFQLDVQNSYLFTYNIFIKILYMFRALPCSSSGGLRCNCIYAASGIVTLCRWLFCALTGKEFFLNRCTGQSPAESNDTRGCIYIQLRRRPPEDEQGNARNMYKILIDVLYVNK
jgi:hypothetical protein